MEEKIKQLEKEFQDKINALRESLKKDEKVNISYLGMVLNFN